MAKDLKNQVEYHDDFDLTEEELVPETAIHAKLVSYLVLVLQWLLRGQVAALYKNLNFYQPDLVHEKPIAPDIAVIRMQEDEDLTSWRLGETGPDPHVVFEIASKETWKNDIEEKPHRYALMGVQEYFFYDPANVSGGRKRGRSLIGWRFNRATGTMQEIPHDQQGRLWSQQLDCFLVPDGKYLRLYDTNNQRCLTGEEAEARRAEAAIRKAEVAVRKAEALAQEKETFAQKLRSLGINPDEL